MVMLAVTAQFAPECIHPATTVDAYLDSFCRLLKTRVVNKFNTQYDVTDRKEHWPSAKTL